MIFATYRYYFVGGGGGVSGPDDPDIAFLIANGNVKTWALIASKEIKGTVPQVAALGTALEL